MKVVTRHLVRPEHLNPHHTLYGGRIAEWTTEAAFIGIAGELGHTGNVVIVSMKDLAVKHPVQLGSILQFQYEVVHVGTTSVEIAVSGVDYLNPEQEYVSAHAIFVTVDENGKKTPHHLGESV